MAQHTRDVHRPFFFFLICMELRGGSHFMSVPCHQAAAECLCPWCGSQAGMRATVFADIWEGVYVLMPPVWMHTHGGCEWSRFRPGLPAQFVRHWPPPEWSRSPTTGRMGWALQTASLIHGQAKKTTQYEKRPNAAGMIVEQSRRLQFGFKNQEPARKRREEKAEKNSRKKRNKN